MSVAYSMDLRRCFARLMGEGKRAAEAGRILNLSRSTASKWGYKVRNGLSLEPKKTGAKPRCNAVAAYKDFVMEVIDQDNDITLVQLQGALEDAHGLKVSLATIHRALKSFGLTYKKRPHRRRAR